MTIRAADFVYRFMFGHKYHALMDVDYADRYHYMINKGRSIETTKRIILKSN